MRAALVGLLLVGLASWAEAGSTFDNSCNGAFSSTTTANCTLTVGSNVNRAIAAALMMQANTATSISCSGAGAASWGLVSGTDSTTTRAIRALIWAGVAPSSGSQTVTCTWTGNVTGHLGVVSAWGVSQSVPMLSGTFGSGTGASASVTVTTAVGDLSIDGAISATGHALSAPTQTQIWLTSPQGQSRCTASGASCVHAWSVATSSGRVWVDTGAKFSSAAANSRRAVMSFLFPRRLR